MLACITLHEKVYRLKCSPRCPFNILTHMSFFPSYYRTFCFLSKLSFGLGWNMCLACGHYSDSAVCKSISCIYHGSCFSTDKTKNLLFNGAKTVMGKTWTSEEKSGEWQPSGPVETPACQTLLRGQMLIGQDGRLKKSNTARSDRESDVIVFHHSGWPCRCMS